MSHNTVSRNINFSKNSYEYQDWADLCRISATFGVILIHSCGYFFYQFGKISLFSWLSANFYDSLARCSVPLFVMLSGALLLRPNSEKNILSQMPRRLARLAIPLFVWGAGYLLYVSLHSGAPINLLSLPCIIYGLSI